MFGGSLVWLQRCLAGVRLMDNAPAYSKILIKPIIPEGLNRASYQIETVRGLVANSWKREGENFEMTTTIPVGCIAHVHLPYQKDKQWMESNTPLKETEYMKILKDEGTICIQLKSGTYHFTNH